MILQIQFLIKVYQKYKVAKSHYLKEANSW